MSDPASAPAPRAGQRRFWMALGSVGAVSLIAVVLAVMLTRPSGGPTPSASLPVTPSTSTPSTSTPHTTAPHPTSCADIYTKDWASTLAPLVLNPAWADAPDSGVRFGTDDADLESVLRQTAGVTCVWAAAGGGSGEGLTTNVAFLTEAQVLSVEDRLKVLDFACAGERGGLRCAIDHVTHEGAWGETHFIRGGIWIATNWVNSNPDGYTDDIVTSVFAGR
jgi:hypothetical protein